MKKKNIILIIIIILAIPLIWFGYSYFRCRSVKCNYTCDFKSIITGKYQCAIPEDIYEEEFPN